MSEITLKEVIETYSGVVIKSSEFFANNESEIFKQRSKLETAIQKNKKLWTCPICGDFIKIKGKWDCFVSMHFSHVANNNPCPLKEKNRFSKEELLRYRYNGQKEGEWHKLLKELIWEKLRSDSRFSDVEVDKRFNGASDEWRKIDVINEAYTSNNIDTLMHVTELYKSDYDKQNFHTSHQLSIIEELDEQIFKLGK